MQETRGLLERISHHDKLSITVNESCKVHLPDDVLAKLLVPHRLAHFCFVYLDGGQEIYQVDQDQIDLRGGQLVFGLPNQVFSNPIKQKSNKNYKLAIDHNTLSLLPGTFPFLLNTLNRNHFSFDMNAKERVRSTFSHLFRMLHGDAKTGNADIILAYLNTLLTEFNSAYFEGQSLQPSSGMSKYIEFTIAVENNLTDQPDLRTLAGKLSISPDSLYGIVKDASGMSPKEWISNRLIQEARRRLMHTNISVKELAFELGFNDPSYFSRLFKKRIGMTVRAWLDARRDLSGNYPD